MRKSLEETWRFLESQHSRVPRHPDGRPAILDRMPSIYDDEPRLSFFGTGLEDVDLSHLTMPRTFFGRSLFERVSFADTDLAESCMCWNDFQDCDFSGADLSGCDMRGSSFPRCKFVGATLRGADLRRSWFEGCDFSGADLRGAIADRVGAGKHLAGTLTAEQFASIVWHDDPGEEPPGG